MRNKYSGTCLKCKVAVEAGQGVYQGGAVYCQSCFNHGNLPQRPALFGSAPVVRELTADGVIKTPYEPENLPLVRSFPGARWDGKQRHWTVSLREADLPRVLEIADRLGLSVPAEIRTKATTQTAQAAAVAMDPRLYPFQVKGVDFLSRRKGGMLSDEMGLGKTVQALCALGDGWRVLVVCPASLKYNWAAEASKWSSKYKVTVLDTKVSWRFPEAGEIVVTSYSLMPYYLKHDVVKLKKAGKEVEAMAIEAALKEIPSGITLIVDEAHAVKSRDAERSRAIRSLSRRAERVWALTGTPLLTSAMDLWGILNNLNLVGEVFSWPQFTKLYSGTKNRWGGWTFGQPSPEVPERLRRVMLRRLRSEVLPDLPDKTIKTIEVNGLDRGLTKEMDELWNEYEDTIEGESKLPPFERFSAIRAKLAESRIPALDELLEDYEESDTPVVVFSAHRAPIDHLSVRKGWAVITGDTDPKARQSIVEQFQAGRLKGIGATITAGGVGITLTSASHVIFTDLDWTPALNQQAEDRVARIGQTANKIEITRLVSRHPLDVHITALIAEKIALIDASIEAEAEAVVPKQSAQVAVAPPQSHVSQVELADLLKALQILTGCCDGAARKDDVGFNRTDSQFGKSLATRLSLTDRQAEAAKRMLRKYRRQLPTDLYNRLYPEVRKTVKEVA